MRAWWWQEAADREMAAAALEEFGRLELAGLPSQVCAGRVGVSAGQVVHGDMNDYNILVSAAAYQPGERGAVDGVGVLDFGDMVRTKRVYNLAVALAYVCQGKSSGYQALQAAAAVVEGYAQAGSLQPAECSCLFECVQARVAQSVAISAHSIQLDPANADYFALNAEPGWQLLRQWSWWDRRVAADVFLTAAGHQPEWCSGARGERCSWRAWARELVAAVVAQAPVSERVELAIGRCSAK